MSAKTDYVFAMADAGSKRADAERLGIPIRERDRAVLAHRDARQTEGAEVARADTPRPRLPSASRGSRPGSRGKTVVLTGTMSRQRLRHRDAARARRRDRHRLVSANTDYLVTGAGVGAAKTSKASALGVTAIDEATLHEPRSATPDRTSVQRTVALRWCSPVTRPSRIRFVDRAR